MAALATCIVLTCLSTAGLATADPPDPSTASPTETSAPASNPPTSESSPPATEPSAPPTESSQPAPPERPGNVELAERPELEVTANFDKPSYHTGDPVNIKLRIKNVGSTRAVGLHASNRVSNPTEVVFNLDTWGDLRTRGVTIEPDATHETSLSGQLGDLDADIATLTGDVFDQSGLGVAEFSFQVPVKKRVGHAGGIVFGDKNNNGRFDSGEGLPGVTLTWGYIYNYKNKYTATSNDAGRFTFPEIPTARYFTSGTAPDGWLVSSGPIEIDQSDKNDDLRIRAVKPLKGELQPSMKFTKDSYQPGELAHVTVTLSNTGSAPLVGIVASCNRAGFEHGLKGSGPGWDALAPLGKGVTIGAGQTRTFDVSEKVPDIAIHTGYVFVSCGFGYSGIDDENNPGAFATAKVPGGIASVIGDVQFFPDGPTKPGQGVAGVKLVLVDDRPCPVVGQATTDGNGHFEFHNLAPGPDYKLYVLPPEGWKVKHENPTPPNIRGNSDNRMVIVVERGVGTLPTVPTQPSTCTAPPTTTPRHRRLVRPVVWPAPGRVCSG